MAVHTTVPTVAVAHTVVVHAAEDHIAVAVVRVAVAVDVGDRSFWPLAVGYSKPEINRAGTRPAPTLTP